MDRTLFDEYNQAFTSKVYDLIPETKEQYVWRELHWAYEQGYAQGKAEALKTGKWVKTGQSFVYPDKFRNYMCSECGYDIEKTKYNYCPNCGAKMERWRNEEEIQKSF